MADLQTLSYLGANLMLGRAPTVEAVFTPTDLPTQNGGGIDVSGAVLALVSASVREHFAWRTCYLLVSNVDLDAEYTVTINGNDVVYDAATETPANLEELLEDLAAAVSADATVGDIVTAAAFDYDGDGTNDCIRIVGKADTDYNGADSDDYSFDASQDGTAELVMVADAVSADVRTIGRPIYSPPTNLLLGAPRLASQAWLSAADRFGTVSRSIGAYGWRDNVFPVNGLSAVRVLATNVVGHDDDGGSVIQRVSAIVAPDRQEASE